MEQFHFGAYAWDAAVQLMENIELEFTKQFVRKILWLLASKTQSLRTHGYSGLWGHLHLISYFWHLPIPKVNFCLRDSVTFLLFLIHPTRSLSQKCHSNIWSIYVNVYFKVVLYLAGQPYFQKWLLLYLAGSGLGHLLSQEKWLSPTFNETESLRVFLLNEYFRQSWANREGLQEA